MNEMSKFEAMGFEAQPKGIKDSVLDPAFTMAMLNFDEDDYAISPSDDWNQGWLKAAYASKDSYLNSLKGE